MRIPHSPESHQSSRLTRISYSVTNITSWASGDAKNPTSNPNAWFDRCLTATPVHSVTQTLWDKYTSGPPRGPLALWSKKNWWSVPLMGRFMVCLFPWRWEIRNSEKQNKQLIQSLLLSPTGTLAWSRTNFKSTKIYLWKKKEAKDNFGSVVMLSPSGIMLLSLSLLIIFRQRYHSDWW